LLSSCLGRINEGDLEARNNLGRGSSRLIALTNYECAGDLANCTNEEAWPTRALADEGINANSQKHDLVHTHT